MTLSLYKVHGPKCWDQLCGGHWVETKNFVIFLIFGRDTTNYRGTLVENVKKAKQSNPVGISSNLSPGPVYSFSHFPTKSYNFEYFIFALLKTFFTLPQLQNLCG
jgi:hypothetical protein